MRAVRYAALVLLGAGIPYFAWKACVAEASSDFWIHVGAAVMCLTVVLAKRPPGE